MHDDDRIELYCFSGIDTLEYRCEKFVFLVLKNLTISHFFTTGKSDTLSSIHRINHENFSVSLMFIYNLFLFRIPYITKFMYKTCDFAL